MVPMNPPNPTMINDFTIKLKIRIIHKAVDVISLNGLQAVKWQTSLPDTKIMFQQLLELRINID